jgi:hypothetical protein
MYENPLLPHDWLRRARQKTARLYRVVRKQIKFLYLLYEGKSHTRDSCGSGA